MSYLRPAHAEFCHCPHRLEDNAIKGASPSSVIKCCFTSTETVRAIRDGEPRTSTSIFTQLLSSDETGDYLLFIPMGPDPKLLSLSLSLFLIFFKILDKLKIQ